MKTLREIDPLFGLLTGVVIAVAYVHTNFASVRYVDDRYQEAVGHSDMNRKSAHDEYESLRGILGEIKDVVKTIETRTWDLRPATQVAPQPVVIQKKE